MNSAVRAQSQALEIVQRDFAIAKLNGKFYGVELKQVELDTFIDWARKVPYFQTLHRTYSADASLSDWVMLMLKDLEKSQALEFQEKMLVNV